MNYDEVIQTTLSLTDQAWDCRQIGEADGYPLFVLTNEVGPQTTPLPSVLIAAGIHGEEPASVVGLLQWLSNYSHRWIHRLRFTVVPCLNPWGYERGIRYGANGKDLNRQFDAPTHPAVIAFCDLVAGQQFDLFMDLHEDCDFSRMYLYENLDMQEDANEPTLGRRILERVRPFVELSDQELAEDMEIQDGMIAVPIDRKTARRFENAPIALYVYGHHTHHAVTVETPGLLPLQKRTDLQVHALEEACLYVTERSR